MKGRDNACFIFILAILNNFPKDVVTTLCNDGHCISFMINEVKEDHALEGYTYKSVKLSEIYPNCLSHCSLDCACISYNEKDDGTECELNYDSSNSDASALIPKTGYRYVSIKLSPADNKCPSVPCQNDCCLPSLCQNYGVCTEVCEHETHRFNCSCREGYGGRLCQRFFGYHGLGCYDENLGNRALRNMYANFRTGIDWSRIDTTIKNCRDEAKINNYKYFGVHYYGECYYDADAENRYQMYGTSTECWNGVGKSGAFYFYKVTDP